MVVFVTIHSAKGYYPYNKFFFLQFTLNSDQTTSIERGLKGFYIYSATHPADDSKAGRKHYFDSI